MVSCLQSEAICFAGAYYRRRVERSRDFDHITEMLEPYYLLEIYDRRPYPGLQDYSYPERYNRMIQGSVPIDQMSDIYKQYQYHITMNTVKNSSTMEGRRVFELLASNTICISNDCRGIHNIFGDLVLYGSDKQLLDKMRKLADDEEYMRKWRLLGLRKILSEHTLENRIQDMLETIGLNKVIHIEPKIINVYSYVTTEEEYRRVRKMFEMQTYRNKKLILITPADLYLESIYDVIRENEENLLPSLGSANYYTIFYHRNYYGKNYLLDLMLSSKYSEADIIGKGSYYKKEDLEIVRIDSDHTYCEGHTILLDRCMMKENMARTIHLSEVKYPKVNKNHSSILYIDEFQFCEDWSESQCEVVDDIEMNSGYSLRQIKQTEVQIKNRVNYTIQEIFSMNRIKELFDDTDWLICERKENCIEYFLKPTEVGIHQLFSKDKWEVSEYIVDNGLFVYCNGSTDSGSTLFVVYKDKEGNYIGKYCVPMNAYQMLPVPVTAKVFHIAIQLSPSSHICLYEIGINAYITEPISLETNQ